jgi:hypothetical protein
VSEPAASPDFRPCPVHGEAVYVQHCNCDFTAIQAQLRATVKRLEDQCKTNLQIRHDMGNLRDIAESRRRKVAELQREVDAYSLALKSIDASVNLARKAVRETTGGRDRLIQNKSLDDPHERIIDSNGQELVPVAGVRTGGKEREAQRPGNGAHAPEAGVEPEPPALSPDIGERRPE